MPDLLAEIFSSKVRAMVLAHVLPRPHLRFSLTDLSRRLDAPVSSLQHECYKLERIGVMRGQRDGNARRYRVNPACPVQPQLTALVAAAVGTEGMLRGAVDGVPGLEIAFATGLDKASPERTCLVLVGDVPLEALDAVIARVEAILGRPTALDIAFFRPDDWRSRVEQRHPYVAGLLAGSRVELLPAAEAGLERCAGRQVEHVIRD